MKVAIVCPALLKWDAVGRSTRFKLEALQASGHRVSIYCETPLMVTHPDLQGHVTYVSLRELLRGALRKESGGFFDHDLYIFEYPCTYSLVRACLLLEGKHLLFDYHGVTPPGFASRDVTRDLMTRSLADLALLEHADRVMTHSAFARQELLDQGPAMASRVEVLPYAVQAPGGRDRSACPGGGRLSSKIPDGRFVLLYVGRLAGNKGIVTLVDALGTLKRSVPEAFLVLAGNDEVPDYRPHRQAALTRASALGVDKDLLLTGPVTEEELEWLYSMARVVVTASLHEGFCYPVAEAMVRGIPVVATTAGAIPETAGSAGLLVAPGDAGAMAASLVRLHREGALRDELAGRSRVESARFHPVQVGRTLEQIVQAVTSRPPDRTLDRLGLLKVAAALEVRYEDPKLPVGLRQAWGFLLRRVTLHVEKYYMRRLQEELRTIAAHVVRELERLDERIRDLEK